MNKPVLGIVVGGILGLLDGFAAPLQAPEVAPEAMGIVIGSTFKGVIVGLIAGFFARKVSSVPLGIAVGLLAGLVFAYLVAAQPAATGKHYYWEIMLPGSLAGAIVGFVTQRYGRRPGVAAAAALLLALLPAARLGGDSGDGPPPTARPPSSASRPWWGTGTATWSSRTGPRPGSSFDWPGTARPWWSACSPAPTTRWSRSITSRAAISCSTHYCAMANQPRMKLTAGGTSGDLVFDFAGGDNVDPKTTTHMHGGRFVVKDANSYEADWGIVSEGKPAGNNRFFMKRAAKSQ